MTLLWPEEKIAYDTARAAVLRPGLAPAARKMLVTLTGAIKRMSGGGREEPRWEPMERAEAVPLTEEKKAIWLAELRKTDPKVTAEMMEAELARGVLWKNNIYTVAVYDNGPDSKGGRFLHLSIKRNDRETVHDWRHLQRIKTEIAGPDAEGVELYPAESRVVDMANQYHLWVFTKAKLEFGFGTDGKAQKMTAEESAVLGSKQREGA